jgi:type IV pilus assembly protein PilY1
MNFKFTATAIGAAILAALPIAALGQTVVSDNFTGASSSNAWQPFLGACLTAGDGTGSIPACIGDAYYGAQAQVGGFTGALPDPVGNGALRFTNGRPNGYGQAGGIISGFTFPLGQGLQVTFTTMTYRGDSGGGGHDGADGIGFFLIDGAYTPYDLGAFGGSLGYTCSNVNNDPKLHPDGTQRSFDGLQRAYLGLGIDEYGNFLNQGDNTATGYGYVPGRIGLRGAGNVFWGGLAFNYPMQYPTGLLTAAQKGQAVQNTCKTGTIWDYSNPATPVNTGVAIPDYAPIPNAFQVLPVGTQIANEAATTRGQATPITYLLKITQNGLLSFSYSYNGGAYQPVITAQNITTGNGPLPASFRFGFSGSTGGSINIHEVTCFQAQPADTSSSSAGLNEKQTAEVQIGSQVYFAFYNPSNWSGSLTSQSLLFNAGTGVLTLAAVANWDAQCVLTGLLAGGTCIATGITGPAAAQAPTARTILTSNGVSGIPFQFASLTAAQQNTIDAGDTPPFTADRTNYLRGDRTNEINALGVGEFRARISVLSDIVDSSPTWVGPPQASFPAHWIDKTNAGGAFPENAGPTYQTFQVAAETRTNLVYAGANDGLLHGFRSGAYTAAGIYDVTAPNDGIELLAYMPSAVLNAMHNSVNPQLDFANAQYGHMFSVDGTPGIGDLYYQGAWHSWLVGGLAAGGSSIFILDITDPTQFAESNAANLVIGDWNPSNLVCANVGGCGANLGFTYGVPEIRRLHNGMWGVLFGNGLGTATGAAGMYVMTVDPASGAKTFYYLSTGANSAGNGIAYVAAADLDGDHITDYVYAGDVHGNVWRFDLTSSNPNAWAVTPGPLFTTPGGQPITTQVVVAAAPVPGSGLLQAIIDFGTGQQIPLTNTTPAVYASGTQALYGIWDANMTNWNAKGSIQYASLAAPPAISLANMTQQTVNAAVPSSSGFRSVSANPVCWKNSTACGSGNTQMGWYLNLPGNNEQIIFNPILQVGALIANTAIPAVNNPYNCTAATATGWTMAISPVTGGAFTQSFFSDSTGHFVNYNGLVVSGVAQNAVGSGSIVSTPDGGTWLVNQTSNNSPSLDKINPLANATGNRLTWVERR